MAGGQNYNKNYKQKELEEAIELDRMLEAERRNQSQDIFQKKVDEKMDSYFNNISSVPNFKNNSNSIRGIFGGAAGGPNMNGSMIEENISQNDYKGLLPNVNSYPTKRDGKELKLSH
jgi:hypothetical protein